MKTALAINPTDPDAHKAYGLLLGQRQDYDRVIAHYLVGYESSNDPNFLISLGVNFLRKGDTQRALDSFLRAYQPTPKEGIFAVHVGDAYQATGNLQDAFAVYYEGAQLVPDWEPLPHRYIG